MTKNGHLQLTLLPGLEEQDARHPAQDQDPTRSSPEVARLIETQYLPQIEGVDGFVSYTLIDLGDDEISSVGVFTTEESAQRANETARSWTAQTLSRYVASPLDARAGAVLIDHRPA